MPRASRSRIQLSEEEKKKRRREQKKLSIRRARAKMSERALEERRRMDRERYKKKKEKGEIKTIKDYTPREQRQMRKIWREKAQKKREREKVKKNAQVFLNENTPPSSPSYSRVSVGRVVAARNRRKIKAENMYLRNRVLQLEAKLSKYRMRFCRLSKDVPKNKKNTLIPKPIDLDTKMAVEDFLLQDEHSRLTSGKNETITRKKVKKQIRFLNDSLLNLHKLFNAKFKNPISYETFRRYRPFWVLFPKTSSRYTCLCSIHTNNILIIRALCNAKIISHTSSTSLLKSLCCNDTLNVACLERKCANCKDKKIDCSAYNGDDTISYERWIIKNVTLVIKGQTKIVKKTIKETVRTTKTALIEIMDSNLPSFMQHVANNLNQLKVVQTIKQQMSPSDGLLHMDFSENYNCKYGQEIQSAHFGGSKPQVSLHTCVFYNTEAEAPDNCVKTTSLCTVSDNLRHDPVMICVHLKPVLKRIKELAPNLKNLHLLSDGPSTQYRNKKMFNLLKNFIANQLQLETVTWHYSETGHGKGAPDGVGGCIKRTCDARVAKGKDVACFDELISCAKDNCKGIEVYPVDDTEIAEIQKILDECNLRPFKGTFKLHQLTWSAQDPNIIHARRLSCLECAAHVICPHFEIGQIDVQIVPKIPENPIDFPQPPEIPSDDFLPQTPVTSARNSPDLSFYRRLAGPSNASSTHCSSSPDQLFSHAPDLPQNPATPDADTEPNTPSPPVTPSEPIIKPRNLSRPSKILFWSSDSDSSDDFPPPKKRSLMLKSSDYEDL